MAAPPSASSLTSSADAFKHPLPSVRQIHRQLDQALEEKNARLRSLVGGSYRQLLGTAETIITMRRDIEIVERKLERVTDGCGRGVVGKKVSGLSDLGPAREGRVRDGEVRDLAWAARVKVLEGCILAAGRFLMDKDNVYGSKQGVRSKTLVAAAKTLVLSRLLLKSLAQYRSEQTITRTEELRKRFAKLRRRLLRAIERSLQKAGRDPEGLVDSLCAYSLATSSGAKDVARYFLHVRGEAIALRFEDDEATNGDHGNEKSITESLALYTGTLLDYQALVPRRLCEALRSLKARALLKDAEFRQIEGLRLDLCEKLLGEELIHFTPYIRHDDLEGVQGVEMLKGWASKASEVLLEGFGKTLSHIRDFKSLVALRTSVFEKWIKEGGRAKGFDSAVFLNQLRGVMNDRLTSLMETRVSKLHLVGTEIEATMADWTSISNGQQTGLWSHQLLDIDLSNGGSQLKVAVVNHSNGRSDALSRVVNSYETWRQLTDELISTISELKLRRWDDDLEDLDDDYRLENRNALLSEEDPALLQKRLDRSLKQSFYELHDKLSMLSLTFKESVHSGALSIFVLRIIREIRQSLPITADLQSFGLSLVPEYHRALALSISSKPVAWFINAVAKRRKVVGKALWEGTPPLPLQPSPALFLLLHKIASSMSVAGSDLWSTSAVVALKDRLDQNISQGLETYLESLDTSNVRSPNGESEDHKSIPPADGASVASAEEEVAKRARGNADIMAQLSFDLLVIRECFELSSLSSGKTAAAKVMEKLRTRSGLAEAQNTRLQNSAQDYWKRTSLLFGPLS